jgi:hypothetical protein
VYNISTTPCKEVLSGMAPVGPGTRVQEGVCLDPGRLESTHGLLEGDLGLGKTTECKTV